MLVVGCPKSDVSNVVYCFRSLEAGQHRSKKLLNTDDADNMDFRGFLFLLYPRQSAQSVFKKNAKGAFKILF